MKAYYQTWSPTSPYPISIPQEGYGERIYWTRSEECREKETQLDLPQRQTS
jgi:hypothetical protein